MAMFGSDWNESQSDHDFDGSMFGTGCPHCWEKHCDCHKDIMMREILEELGNLKDKLKKKPVQP
jgi:hypothetical protein